MTDCNGAIQYPPELCKSKGDYFCSSDGGQCCPADKPKHCSIPDGNGARLDTCVQTDQNCGNFKVCSYSDEYGTSKKSVVPLATDCSKLHQCKGELTDESKLCSGKGEYYCSESGSNCCPANTPEYCKLLDQNSHAHNICLDKGDRCADYKMCEYKNEKGEIEHSITPDEIDCSAIVACNGKAVISGCTNKEIFNCLSDGSYTCCPANKPYYCSSIERCVETNNACTTPDITVAKTDGPLNFTPNTPLIIKTEIKNEGYADSGPFKVACLLDGALWGDIDIQSLKLREIHPISVEFKQGLAPGKHSVLFLADFYGAINELHEDNNEAQVEFTVRDGVQPPLDLTVKRTAQQRAVKLSWIQPEDPTSLKYYIVYKATGETFEDTAHVSDVDIEFPEAGLPSNACFAVSAMYYTDYEYYESARTNTVCVSITGSDAIEAPRLSITVPANSTGTELQLSWTPVKDTDGGAPVYMVYRLSYSSALSEFNYDFGFPVKTTGITYIDRYVSPEITYYYGVRAVSYSGTESWFSNIVSANSIDSRAPNPPRNLFASGLDQGASIVWDTPVTDAQSSSSDLAGYSVYRRTSNSTFVMVSDRLVTDNYYLDSGLVNGMIYFYVVVAEDAYGNRSPFSSEASATPKASEPPPAPGNLSISCAFSSISLFWDPVRGDNLVGYNLYRGTAAGNYNSTPLNGTKPIGDTAYSDNTVQSSSRYYYIVRAVNRNGQEGDSSNEVSGLPQSSDVYIVTPTFNRYGVIMPGQDIVIEYYLSEAYESLYASRLLVKLEVRNAGGGVVYSATDDSPRDSIENLGTGVFSLNPNFVWNGTYKNGKAVPSGLYSTNIIVYVDGAVKRVAREVDNVVVENGADVKVKLVDNAGKLISLDDINKDKNFLSDETLTIYYRLTPELPETSYRWEVSKAQTSSIMKTGDPVNFNHNFAQKSFCFIPKHSESIGATSSALKSKGLKYSLQFILTGEDKPLYEFIIEQDDINRARQEIKIAFPSVIVPDRTSFKGVNIRLFKGTTATSLYPNRDMWLDRGNARIDSLLFSVYKNVYYSCSWRSPYYDRTLGNSYAHSGGSAVDCQPSGHNEQTPQRYHDQWDTVKDIASTVLLERGGRILRSKNRGWGDLLPGDPNYQEGRKCDFIQPGKTLEYGYTIADHYHISTYP